MQCQKCSTEEKFVYGEGTKLVGGYTTYLCANCINRWHEYITVHRAYINIRNLAHKLQLRGAEMSEQDFDALYAKHEQYMQDLYHIGKDWVNG